MKKAVVFVLVILALLMAADAGFWKYVYWPIRETAFTSGAEVGYVIHTCHVQPTKALLRYLSHFVAGDVATHNCDLLSQEEKRSQP